MPKVKFEYSFKFEDATEKSFTVTLEETGLLKLPEPVTPPPDWAKLDHFKCSHCPYDSGRVPHCPVAKNLAQVSDAFKDEKSFRKTTVFVKGPERFYGRQTDVQTGLQSLFGLIMATSDCPHMEFLRPLAKFHLPFSSLDETKARVLGNYLVAQLEKKQRGEEPDFEANELGAHFGRLNILNQGIIERIRSVSEVKGDADRNAIVLLDAFASLQLRDPAPPKK